MAQWAQTSWLEIRSSIGRYIDLSFGSTDSSVLDKKKVKFSTDTHRLHGLLELVYVDVWGPTKTASLGGHHDYSRRCWLYPMRQRVEALELLVK